jgi:outer membrane protein TolC
MFIAKNKLDELESLGEIQFQAKVIETVYNVTAAYYNVVKQEQQLKSINEAINYNKERVKIAQIGYDSGSLIKTDFLQAKIDLNVALENSINQQYAIDQAKKDLNLLLGQMVGVPFTVSENIPFDYKPDKALLIQRLNTSNYDILALNKQLQIAQLTLRESKKANLPQVSVRGGYYFSNTDNSVGNTLRNQVYGARINVLSAEYELSEVKNQVNTELEKALIDFDNQQQLMEIEKENNQLAKENFEISLQRLRLGQTISLEVHQAEEDYVQSCTRLINFQYNLKIAEMRLKQLVSGL